MRKEVIEKIKSEKIIVIVRDVKRDKLVPLAKALYDGGIRLMEVTYSADKTVSDEETAQNIKLLIDTFKGKMHIGAGTVMSKKQVELTKNVGGEFIISPNVCEEVIKTTKSLDMVSIPGALTPSECEQAYIFGADFVKLFPVSSLGVPYVKAIKAPLSHIKFLAVGGINEENMSDYLSAGVCGFGVGSNIINKKMLENNDFKAVTALAEKYTFLLK